MAKQNTGNKTTQQQKKKSKVEIQPVGRVYVFSGYNNTIVSVTNMNGDVICWGASGKSGFKGSKQATPYAATVVGESVAKEALERGVKEVSVYMKGVGAGKSQCVKSIRNAGLVVSKIVDVTPIAHNGCRAKKRRRL